MESTSVSGLSHEALALLVYMREPASEADIPGDYYDKPIIERFGLLAVDECLALGFLQRGGFPGEMPPSVRAEYEDRLQRFAASERERVSRGESPAYPCPTFFLLLTTAGWNYSEKALSALLESL